MKKSEIRAAIEELKEAKEHLERSEYIQWLLKFNHAIDKLEELVQK